MLAPATVGGTGGVAAWAAGLNQPSRRVARVFWVCAAARRLAAGVEVVVLWPWPVVNAGWQRSHMHTQL